MPIVSFIITYYSEPLPLLAECLRSVLQVRSLMMQRGMAKQDFEIVVVDDGSQLSPLGMLKQMDEDICYIRQANAGLSAARNAGLAAAHGEYVPVSYTHLRAHETKANLVCRLLLEKKK